jgi:hypothetical protein
MPLYAKHDNIILPRQARDKHRDSTQKEMRVVRRHDNILSLELDPPERTTQDYDMAPEGMGGMDPDMMSPEEYAMMMAGGGYVLLLLLLRLQLLRSRSLPCASFQLCPALRNSANRIA